MHAHRAEALDVLDIVEEVFSNGPLGNKRDIPVATPEGSFVSGSSSYYYR